METIDEKINYDEYEGRPQDLVKLARTVLKEKKYEPAIEILENAIKTAIKKYGKENHPECAKFYTSYAEGIITKLFESGDILAIPARGAEPIKEEKEIKEAENDPSNDDTEENKPAESDTALEPVSEEEETDEQIATENLSFAEQIYLTHTSEFTSLPSAEVPDEIKKYFLELSEVYDKFGELEMSKSDFRKASEFFLKSLDLHVKYDGRFSRSTAEVYFNLGCVYDFDIPQSLLCYYKTKVIMEHHLIQQLLLKGEKAHAEKIVLNGDDLDLTKIEVDHPGLFVNVPIIKSLLNDLDVVKHKEVSEFLEIVNDLNDKLEDIIIDLGECEKLQKEKENLLQENQFTENYDKEKVVDISSSMIIKKRARPDANKEPEEEGGKRLKLEDGKQPVIQTENKSSQDEKSVTFKLNDENKN